MDTPTETPMQATTLAADGATPTTPTTRDQAVAFIMRAVSAVFPADGPAPSPEVLPNPAVHSYLPGGSVARPSRGLPASRAAYAAASATPSSAAGGPSVDPRGAVVELPLLCLYGVSLFPGETLPLRVDNTPHMALLERLAAECADTAADGAAADAAQGLAVYPGCLGVMLRPRGGAGRGGDGGAGGHWCKGRVGTTAEVLEVRRLGPAAGEQPQAARGAEVVAVCLGVRRFIVLDGPWRRQGVLWASARLLDGDTNRGDSGKSGGGGGGGGSASGTHPPLAGVLPPRPRHLRGMRHPVPGGGGSVGSGGFRAPAACCRTAIPEWAFRLRNPRVQ